MIKKIECVSCTPSDPNCPTCGQTGTDGQYEVLSGLKLTDHNGVVYYVRALYAVLVNTTAQSISIVQNGLTVFEIRLNDTTYNTLQELAAAACACNGASSGGGGTVNLSGSASSGSYTITPSGGGTAVNVPVQTGINAGLITAEQVALLPPPITVMFDSNFDAAANGIPVGGLYWAGPAHMDASWGTLKFRTS